jgi:hypothetical protein
MAAAVIEGRRLSGWPAGEPAGHGDCHRPVHDGFVVGGQAFVLSGDPGYPELALFCVVRDGPVLGGSG